jgi:isopenicillin N synthase-like dioxygenase
MSKYSSSQNVVPQSNEIVVAPLETIDFARLLSKEPAEVSKMLRCSRVQGFFYLDLQNESTLPILAKRQHVLRLMERYFAQPEEVKKKDDKETHLTG